LSQLLSQPFPQPVGGEQPTGAGSQAPLRHSIPQSVGAESGQLRQTPLTQLAPLGQQTSPQATCPVGQLQVPMIERLPLTMQALAVLQQLVCVQAAGKSLGQATQKAPPLTGRTARVQLSAGPQQLPGEQATV
jgi:hypothetical protein